MSKLEIEQKIKPEDLINPSDNYLDEIGELYANYYTFRSNRSSNIRQFQNQSFEDYLKISRELFWNSLLTESDDLRELGLEFSLPFIRKEVLDFTGRITSMNVVPKLIGDDSGAQGVKVLQGMYQKWRLKSKDKVEKFWQILYGVVNGTVCNYVGFDGEESLRRYLTSYNPETGDYNIDEKRIKMWNDVFSEIVPIEEIYLEKIWERNIQKQGKVIRKFELIYDDFKTEFKKYKNSEFVIPGNRIDDESLFFKLLGGTGVETSDKVQVLMETDIRNDKFKVAANGIWLNPISEDVVMPLPFKHKMQPYVWSIQEPIDEKFAYGLSLPFKLKDPHKILNSSYTMLVERELRAIDPPVLTSDFEAPQIIFGQNRVIPVNDINAYKELNISEASGQFLTMQNSLQGLMSSFGQGGFSQVAPSRQPKSAREIVQLENLKQQSLGNALIMYFDLVYQELFLVLKTALQFYQSGKYDSQRDDLIRAITVPNFPLSTGGLGNLEVRIVKKPKDALQLYFESVNRSIENGKSTEILEVPVDVLNNLEVFIEDIRLEPEKSSELEMSLYVDQVVRPMLEVYVPAGVADINKVFARHLEKMGEHISDYASDQSIGDYVINMTQKRQQALNNNQQQLQVSQGAQQGNMVQSNIGTRFGGQNNMGLPAEELEV